MTKFINITENSGDVIVDVTTILTVNQSEVLSQSDIGIESGTVAEGNHEHQTIVDNTLKGQTIDSGVTAPGPVYFNQTEGMWKQYIPGEQGMNNVPGLFIGDNTVALNGAIINLVFDSDILLIDDNGMLLSKFNKIATWKIIGYRVGSSLFKIHFDEYDYGFDKFGEKIQADDLSQYDSFGRSVSISGNVAIFGAFGEDTNASDAGAAYIYRYDGRTWNKEQKLLASEYEYGDRFGNSVSISGDVALVGAYLDDTGGYELGAVYVFRYNGTTWEEEAKLQASDKEEYDEFGCSVSICDNVAIIGSHYEATGGTNIGSAYIFRYDGTTWVEEQKIQASDKQAHDQFGNAVCIDGNVAIVGADWKSDGGSQAGAAYVFRYDGSTWGEEQKLQANDKEEYDFFGKSVSISGNVVVVGACYQGTTGLDDTGAAYVYRYNGSYWYQEAKLEASDRSIEKLDEFGCSVSIYGNVALVGARYESTGAVQTGATYVYKYNGSTWVEEIKLQANDKDDYYWFGCSVSISDNIALIGAEGENSSGSSTGAAYAFDLTNI